MTKITETLRGLAAEHGRVTVALCLIVIFGAPLLMLVNIGAAPFWVDEAIAALPAEQIHHTGLPKTSFDLDFLPWQLKYELWDPATPLYRYCLAAFTAFTGFSDSTARAFSVLMGALLAVPLFLLVRRVFDDFTALLSVTFIEASPTFMFHAREARHFTFVILLVTCTLYFVHRAQRDPQDLSTAWWFVCLIAALLAQTLAYLVLYVAGFYILFNGGPRRFFAVRYWPFYLAAGGVYSVTMAVFWHTLPLFNPTGCFNHTAGCHPSFFYYFIPLSEFLAPSSVGRNFAAPLTIFSLNHVLFLLGLWSIFTWVRSGKMERSGWSLVLLWFFVPFYLLSTREVKYNRYLFQWVMPSIAIFIAVGLLVVLQSRLLKRHQRLVAPVLVLLVVLAPQADLRFGEFRWGLWRYVKNNLIDAPRDNFEKIRWQSEQLAERMQPGDVVVSSFDDASLQYYLKKPVYGFVASTRTDEFFNTLLDDAEHDGFRVWFVDSIPEMNVCLIVPEDPVEVDCRVKYRSFYRRCTDTEERSPACERLWVEP